MKKKSNKKRKIANTDIYNILKLDFALFRTKQTHL